MVDAIIIEKKWLNEALATQKLHRNNIDPIKQSTDEPVLELLLNIGHADLEIPSASQNHRKLICNPVFKIKQGEAL